MQPHSAVTVRADFLLFILMGFSLIIGCAPKDPHRVKFDEEVSLLKKGDKTERENAALHLADYKTLGDVAIPALIAAMDDPEPKVRAAAAYAVGKLNADSLEATIKLLDVVLKDKDTEVRKKAFFGIMVVGKPTHKAQACKALFLSKEKELRLEAIMKVESIGDAAVEFIPSLLDGLKDPDGDIRMYCAYAIGGLGRKASDAIPFFKKMSVDKNAAARKAAATALKMIKEDRSK
jgi:HEAT repeat protein